MMKMGETAENGALTFTFEGTYPVDELEFVHVEEWLHEQYKKLADKAGSDRNRYRVEVRFRDMENANQQSWRRSGFDRPTQKTLPKIPSLIATQDWITTRSPVVPNTKCC